MNNIVYSTLNKVNNKIYVGIHQTDDLDDGYLGSGDLLKKAILKYGKEAFVREVLFSGLTREDASAIESHIVDKDFIERKDTYNLALGGRNMFLSGDRNPMNNPETREKAATSFKENMVKRRGVTHPMKLSEYKDKLKSSLLSKYGVDNIMKSPEGKTLQKESLKNKYGVDSYFKTPEFKVKTKNTLIEKYGVDNIYDMPGRREKILKTRRLRKEERLSKGEKSSSDKCRETVKRKMEESFPVLLEDVILLNAKGTVEREGTLDSFRHVFSSRARGSATSELISFLNKGTWKSGKHKGKTFKLKSKL